MDNQLKRLLFTLLTAWSVFSGVGLSAPSTDNYVLSLDPPYGPMWVSVTNQTSQYCYFNAFGSDYDVIYGSNINKQPDYQPVTLSKIQLKNQPYIRPGRTFSFYAYHTRFKATGSFVLVLSCFDQLLDKARKNEQPKYITLSNEVKGISVDNPLGSTPELNTHQVSGITATYTLSARRSKFKSICDVNNNNACLLIEQIEVPDVRWTIK